MAINLQLNGQARDRIGEGAPPRILFGFEMKFPLSWKEKRAQIAAKAAEVGGFGDGHRDDVLGAAAGFVDEGVHGHGGRIMAGGVSTRSRSALRWGVRYVRVIADEGGRSRFEDAELPAEPGHTVDGVPPLLLSGPFAVRQVVFVEVPTETPDWEPHVAPRRQWLIVLSGRAAITVSDGERREFGTGDVLLMEDTSGEGHLSTPLAGPLRYAMIPTGD